MLRCFALIAVMMLARAADARLVVRVPTVVDTCPKGTSWDEVAKCLHHFGDVTVLRTTVTARVVSVRKQLDAEVRDAGIYLYITSGTHWILGGMYGQDAELIAFEPIKVERSNGYRLEVASVISSSLTLADQTVVPATQATTTSVYCAGDSHECAEAVTSCDLFVRGKAYLTFRGRVRLHRDEVEIVGDRTKAGECAPPEPIAIRWATVQ
jgi:hypothetical protein